MSLRLLLPGPGVAALLTSWPDEPRVYEREAGELDRVVNAESIDYYLNTGCVSADEIAVVSNGAALHPDRHRTAGRTDPAKLRSLYEDGHTIRLGNLRRVVPFLADVSRGIQQETGYSNYLHAFVTHPADKVCSTTGTSRWPAPEDLEQVVALRSHEIRDIPRGQLRDGQHRRGGVVAQVREVAGRPHAVQQAQFVLVKSRPRASSWMRRRDRTSERRRPVPFGCTAVHTGHGSSAGHSRGPATELSPAADTPCRGCRRVAVRRWAARAGNTASISTGRGGVVRVTKSLPSAFGDAGCTPVRIPATGVFRLYEKAESLPGSALSP